MEYRNRGSESSRTARSVTERLQNVLAAAGIASRRASAVLITQGRVTVDGDPVVTPGYRLDPTMHAICVDGRPVATAERGAMRYIALYKPAGYVTTAHEQFGRRSIMDLLGTAHNARLYPVGRLDYESEGLLLLTNDGDVTFRVTHPRYGVEKEYLVSLGSLPTDASLNRLRSGILLDGVMTRPASFERVASFEGSPAVRVCIHEGRNRQIRRMFAAEGVAVTRLLRTRVGPVRLGDLRSGAWRPLRAEEISALRRLVDTPT
jgi:pseudouridine synthase